MQYLMWGAALTAAVVWLGIIIVKEECRSSTAMLALPWWVVSFAMVLLSGANVVHLAWLMPLVLLVAFMVGVNSFSQAVVMSLVMLGPPMAGVALWG